MRLPSSERGLADRTSSISLATVFRAPSQSRDIDYNPVDTDGNRILAMRPAKSIKSVLLIAMGAVVICIALAELLERGLVSGLDTHRSFQKTSSAMRGTVKFMEVPAMRPYIVESSCVPDGRICICSQGFILSGSDVHNDNIFTKMPGATGACNQWHFQVGDVILVEKPSAVKQEFIPAMVVAAATNSPVVHTAIVTKVPPPGVNQTAENVIITEALKGAWKQVLQNSLREIVERFPFGGISIRRVDAKKYPRFFSPDRLNRISEWADKRVGEGFDNHMLIPIKRRFTTGNRYIPINPSCADRKRAVALYNKAGGPGRWICSELVAWALAFAGGINTDYGAISEDCEEPSWKIKNVQPFPGELSDAEFFDPAIRWRMPCDETGCFVAVPETSQWAGGTTGTTTVTSTTSTSTSTTSTSTTTTMTTSTSTTVTTTTLASMTKAATITVLPRTFSTPQPQMKEH